MTSTSKAFIAASLIVLASSAALANVTDIKGMSDGSEVSVTGQVENVRSTRDFTLHDSTGVIDVQINSTQSVALRIGDRVTVNGVLDKGATGMGAKIKDGNLDVKKDITTAVNDVIEANTAVSPDGISTYNIVSLPQKGMAKISGIVTDVENEKKFTMKDSTGSINVDMADGAAAITVGTQVTVIGYMDRGLLSREITASKLLVVSDATSAAY